MAECGVDDFHKNLSEAVVRLEAGLEDVIDLVTNCDLVTPPPLCEDEYEQYVIKKHVLIKN